MKLRNKKTGETGCLIVGRGSNHYVVVNDEWNTCDEYNSLAELNEEWKDASEEPKKYWCINWGCAGVCENKYSDDYMDEFNKAIGNYFSSKEEAEKAVERLRAWKRLKNNGFRFLGIKDLIITYSLGNYDNSFITQINKDLDLLFGGEE